MEPNNKEGIFYGWYIVAVTFMCRFMATGVGFYIFNAFMDPMVETRGWSREDINLAPVISGIIMLGGGFIFGTLVMRTGPRILMTIGAVVSGIAFACLGQVQQIWQFYAFFVLLGLGNSAMATIVANTAVNNWFILKRGQAQGLSFSGISFSGALLPLTAMFIMARSDLSTAFMVIGASIVLLSPVAWFVVRNRPEDHGLRPDGLPAKSTPPEIVRAPPGTDIMDEGIAADHDPSSKHWTFSMVVRSGNFWKLGTAIALSMMGVLAVMFQLTPRFMDMGFSKQNAMYMMSLTALIGAGGKYFWGSFCDRYEPRKVIALLMVANSIGLALGLVEGSMVWTLLFVVVFGFAMGGVATAGPIMVAHLFGRESYASVARFMGFLGRLSIFGYMIARESLRLTDSYDAAFVVFIILNLIAAALIISTKVAAPLPSEN